jgi:thiol-disulfide isomerase/thioredoxin
MLMLIGLSTIAQDKNKVIVDEQRKSDILIGICDRQGLNNDVFREYFRKEYENYSVDTKTVDQIQKLRKDLEIVVVMGSWCHDSKVQVPRFYKILDETKIKDSKVKLIAVDSKKTAVDIDIASLNIQRVPTFIFYKNGNEIGRIVEKPNSTLEKDMLLILMMASQ